MDKKVRFHDAPVQLVQNVHRFASCDLGQVTLRSSALCTYSTKAKNMVKSMVSVLFASLCIKSIETRWAAPRSNCKQSHALSTNNEVSITNVQNVQCCASSRVVLPLVCHAALYFRMKGKQNTRQIARFRCCLKIFVHSS